MLLNKMNTFVSSFGLVILALVSLVSSVPNHGKYSLDIENGADSGKLSEDKDVFAAVGGLEVVQEQFHDFINKYNKVYVSPSEKQKRLRIFAQNLKRYKEMTEMDRGTAVYGVNKFSDMSVEEFRSKFTSLRRPTGLDAIKEVYDGPELRQKEPKEFDWRAQGAVTDIKDQLWCGSCWAFSAVATLEGLYYAKYKKLETFSEQQIVDCDTRSYGCNGGWMFWAIEYVKEAGGLEKEDDYPYQSADQVCSFNISKAVLNVASTVYLPRDEKRIADYLHQHGPISVAVDASAMDAYREGIAHPNESSCGKTEDDLNHGVTLVGYGVKVVKDGKKKRRLPFWIIKNSWGRGWGQKGYYYLYRGDNSCGIHLEANSAKLV